MSIFFDFDVGPSGRRFRRAVSGDKCDIELFWDRTHTERLFGEVDICALIEFSTLSICMLNGKKEVVGFMALCDHPNLLGVAPDDWETWIRNMYQKFYMSRNTLFVQFMCCKDAVLEYFLDEAFVSVFQNDVYLWQIVLLVNSGCEPEHISRYQIIKKRTMYKYSPKRLDDSETSPHFMHVALRQDFCPKLRIRRAVEEDNDDIVNILDKNTPRLIEMYGHYYISELIGRHPESQRKIIVAEHQERAVGVMCLNSDISYTSLQQLYDLRPYYGLMKATPLEKEQLKRSNVLLNTFGEPIMSGKFSPFDRPSSYEEVDESDSDLHFKDKVPRYSTDIKKQGKVNFKPKPNLPSRGQSQEHNIVGYTSEDYSEKLILNSPTHSIFSQTSVVHLLDEDPFDYEIVNIDKSLLSLSDAFSCELLFKSRESSLQSRCSKPMLCKRRRKQSTSKYDRRDSEVMLYAGEPNAFMIELFGLHDDVDDRNSIDFLEAAFEIMKTYDYCIIRVPSADKSFSLLQHFTFVPSKPRISCQYSLYIAHRSSVIGKLRVRPAELMDIPQISRFLQNVQGQETIYTIEHSILEQNTFHAYVFMSGLSLIGVAILESPQELNFVRAKYDIDLYHNHKYHLEGVITGFSAVKVILVYPVFEVHFRFFAREMLRLSGGSSLIWMTAYRNKLVARKANTLASAMVPLLPRKTDMDFSMVPELVKISGWAKNMLPFSTWFMDKKMTSIPKADVSTRIVIWGASRTAMAFLKALLFGDASTYLTFTNVTLISLYGFPYMRKTNAAVEMMFPKYHNNSEKYLKSVPYTYYVNSINGTVVEINKKEKYVTLSSGSKYYYDLLFLLFGKQYQSPDYLKPLQVHNNMCSEKAPYVRLDVPKYYVEPDIINYDIPENVFIINHVVEANSALKYVRALLTVGFDFQVVVYGATIHAYCCLTALLEMNVPPKTITFVDPFPPEDPHKTRVSVFHNCNVDKTVMEVVNGLQVKVYRSYYFQSWTTIDSNVSHVEFMSQFHKINLECSAFFYYGKRGVNTQAFLAVNKCGMAYDDGILIDHQFHTKDPSIYAAGPATSYYRRYFGQSKKQKYYDSYEVGEKLGIQIRNELDPLFTEKSQPKRGSVRFSTDVDVNPHPSTSSSRTIVDGPSTSSKSSIIKDSKKPTDKLPDFVKPLVCYCRLPGGLQYLEVRSPGKKIPHCYVQSLHYNGIVMETFKTGYFKLHMTNDLVVDGITCLTDEKYSLETFKNLYGQSSVILNYVHLRYMTKKLDDFFNYFRSPWAYFLYHDQTDELFAMVKELLPKGHSSGDTLKEALRAAAGTLVTDLSTESKKMKMREKFEASPYIEAVTNYVIEWLSEHDVILPMYLQPAERTDFTYDTKRNPYFRKKKMTLTQQLMRRIF